MLSKKQVDINDISYDLIKGSRLPAINSSLSYSAVSDDFGSLNDAIKDDWSFGMNVSIGIPIYTGRNLIMQQHQAKISIDQSEHSYLNLLKVGPSSIDQQIQKLHFVWNLLNKLYQNKLICHICFLFL